MKANTLPKQGRQPTEETRRRPPVSAEILRQRYEVATFPLFEHFATIDAWLTEHAPDLWQQIRQEDDELFRLRQLGAPARTYQTRLDTLLKLCEQAERLYYEAQPNELSLPALASGERVALYFKLDDGSFRKVSSDEAD